MKVLFPRRCLCCDRVLSKEEERKGCCRDCAPSMVWVEGRICSRCGKMLSQGIGDLCGDCMGKGFSFLAHRAIFLYTPSIKPGIYRFKYGNRRILGSFFAEAAVMRYGRWIKDCGIEAIVPVPMHKRKQRKRGYNQAGVFAGYLGRLLDIPVEGRWVERCINTSPQKGLDEQKRYENLKNAFKLSKNIVKFNCVLVVDDIYTTGTTMDQVAKVLRTAGVKRVYGLSVCIGGDR